MFFGNEDLSVSIINVMELDQRDVVRRNAGRSFDAISFRFRADTALETDCGVQRVYDNYICYVPSDVGYTRTARVDKLIAVNCKVNGYHAEDIECFLPENPEKIAKMFLDIYALWESNEAAKVYKCTAILYRILAECCIQKHKSDTNNSKIQKSVDYINANYTDPSLSVSDAAACSYMSEVYFRKLFKSEYGISPQKYIIALRLARASELIRNGDYSLKEVAFMSGYSDYKYFSTEFKRVKGSSPSDYR